LQHHSERIKEKGAPTDFKDFLKLFRVFSKSIKTDFNAIDLFISAFGNRFESLTPAETIMFTGELAEAGLP
jgi:hypothetical protein